MHSDIKEILISEEEIQRKVKELGKKLSEAYRNTNPLCVSILKGSIPFTADLIRAMDIPIEVDFMAVSSYGVSTKSTGVVRIIKDLETPVENRDVLIIEDIVDTGLTLSYLVELLKGRKARTVKTVTFLDKPSQRTVNYSPDFYGFTVPNHFVVGYGLDYAEKYRNLPYVGVLKEEVYRS